MSPGGVVPLHDAAGGDAFKQGTASQLTSDGGMNVSRATEKRQRDNVDDADTVPAMEGAGGRRRIVRKKNARHLLERKMQSGSRSG